MPHQSIMTKAVAASSHRACAASAVAGEDDHDRVVSLRFRTEPCRSFQVEGTCPYDDKCMFFHEAKTVRTREMNEEDNLISDVAIRAWIYRRRRQALRRTAAKELKLKSSPPVAAEPQSDGEDASVAARAIRVGRRPSTDSYDAGSHIDFGVVSALSAQLGESATDICPTPHSDFGVDSAARSPVPSSSPPRALQAKLTAIYVPAAVVFVRSTPGWYRRDPYSLTGLMTSTCLSR